MPLFNIILPHYCVYFPVEAIAIIFLYMHHIRPHHLYYVQLNQYALSGRTVMLVEVAITHKLPTMSEYTFVHLVANVYKSILVMHTLAKVLL